MIRTPHRFDKQKPLPGVRKKNAPRLISWAEIVLWVLVIYIVGAALMVGLLVILSKDLPSIERLQKFDPELITRIYSGDGVVLHELYTQRRTYVPFDKIPPAMVQAVIAIEDGRFLNHWGFSLRDFLRAVVIDIATLSKSQGASTLTQQLARILYEEIGFKKTIIRKIKEGLTALQIERMYSKDEIAMMYINSSYMGHGVYGIQAAAKRYFNKPAQDLEPEECALIAGIIKHSGRFSPFWNPVSSFQRRNLVLMRMFEKGFLTEEQYLLYRSRPLQIEKAETPPRIAPYFVEAVRQWLQQEDDKLGVDIYRDGLSVYTTLDTRIQTAADSALLNHLVKQQNVLSQRLLRDRQELQRLVPDTSMTIELAEAMLRGEIPMSPRCFYSMVVQGALVAIEPSTGRVLAMIGGRNFSESEFNRALQARTRQPGSVFKPIVYATAIDNGYPITTRLLNQPVVLNMSDGTRWAPKNYDQSTGGLTTLREGLRASLNLVAVRILQELISPTSVVETARRMHLTTSLPAVEALALGAGGVSPIEITSAYGIFANRGIWVEPIMVTRIEDRYGNVIAEYSSRQDMVFSEETAYLMTHMLETVVNRGTGRNIRDVFGFRVAAAGKTGTTNDFSDAWFVGYTPKIVAGVWIGVDNPAVTLGENEGGARAALPAWARFMKETYRVEKWKDEKFVRPEGVVEIQICSETKLLPAKYCPVETEVFEKSTVPTEYCREHEQIKDNKRWDSVRF